MEQLSICGVEPESKVTATRRKTRQPTRGDFYGIKASALARDARGKLTKIRAKLEKLPEPWLEADTMLEQATARVLEAIDALSQQFIDSAEYLNETMD